MSESTHGMWSSRIMKLLLLKRKMFSQKEARKTYWAVVKNRPPLEEATLLHWLKKNPKQNKSYAHDSEVTESKRAELNYRILQQLNNYYLLEIELKTGRHHQIRAQLAAIGCSIKGDLKYGADRSNQDGSIHLHARQLEFIHPVKKEPVSITARPPDDPIWNECVKNN